MDWQFRGADFRKFNTETLKHILNALEAFSDPYTIYIYIYMYVWFFLVMLPGLWDLSSLTRD